MKPFRVKTLLTVFLLLQVAAAAQEMPGTTLGNYAGVNSLQLNPSALHNSKSHIDIQVAGLDLFLQNNALFISKSEYRFVNFFKSGYQWPTHIEFGVEERTFYRYDNALDKSAFIQERYAGPGAMLIRDEHAFALTTGIRTVLSLENVPYDVANFAYLGLGFTPQQDINYIHNKPFTVSAMAWGEIGLSYANAFYAHGFNRLSAGITVKGLLGLGGMYLNAARLDYVIPDDSTININNLEAVMGFALPVDYNTNQPDLQPIFKGAGIGFDVGFTYQRLSRFHQDDNYSLQCAKPYEDYLYRIGVALIDIGGIRFSNNAAKMNVDNRSSRWDNVNTLEFRNINQMLDTISYQFYGNNTSAYSGEKFTLWLPSALSVQFDYHLRKNWYVNANIIYGFTLARGSLARPAELSITPRYETRIFEASLPISLYDWSQPRVGLAVRIYGFTIGTDKIGGFFHFSDFSGLDFYFSVKVFFNKGSCRKKGDVHCGYADPES